VRCAVPRGGRLRRRRPVRVWSASGVDTRVGLHTRATLVDDIVARVDGDRPDAVPNFVATQLTDGHPDYLQWIIYETADAVDRRAATDARRTVRAGGRWHWGHSR
jgi:CutA1 divalent ion tolerance protein